MSHILCGKEILVISWHPLNWHCFRKVFYEMKQADFFKQGHFQMCYSTLVKVTFCSKVYSSFSISHQFFELIPYTKVAR